MHNAELRLDPDSTDGRLLSNSSTGDNEARVGFMAQSDPFSSNCPALIYTITAVSELLKIKNNGTTSLHQKR